ncbi:MAG: SixA phosphatase family protein [Hydrogenophaga sp.]
MDLILWRHAQAHEHPDPLSGRPGDALDLARRLTPRGEKQAARMAAWLDRQLPTRVPVYASPAVRTEQTAAALGRKVQLCEPLLPEAEPQAVLTLAQWPQRTGTLLVVGHQPTLGRVIAQLLGMSVPDLPVKKGSIWWLRSRERLGQQQTTLVSVQTPDLL